MFCRSVLAIAFLICLQPAHADIIISFESTSISTGAAGAIDVWLESSDGSDTLSGFSAQFRITGPTASGNLIFADTGDQTNDQAFDGYVFKGNPAVDPINYSAIRSAPQEIKVADFLNLPANQLLGTTRWLLARIELLHIGAVLPNAIGDTYTVRLIEDEDDTFFYDGATDVNIAAESFTNEGAIRVIAGLATAVPEPTSFGAFAFFASLSLAGLKRRTALRLKTEAK